MAPRPALPPGRYHRWNVSISSVDAGALGVTALIILCPQLSTPRIVGGWTTILISDRVMRLAPAAALPAVGERLLILNACFYTGTPCVHATAEISRPARLE